MANPKIATLSGKEASIFVGDRVPIVLTGEDGGHEVNFLEAGIDLKVTPKISDDQYITILVKPEVSTFIWKSDTDYPQIRTREAETNVRVKDGQPIIIGGLIQEEETELITKIPFLAELPVLGKLFQWKELKKNQTEMTIFMIPRIVKGEQVEAEQSFFSIHPVTASPKEDDIYVQGYWVEYEKARLLGGGVSAARESWEVGLGLLYKEKQLGLTGYVQYGLPALNCRLQLDLQREQRWLPPHLSLGIPIPYQQFKLEPPHLVWPLEEPAQAKLGMRLQYQF